MVPHLGGIAAGVHFWNVERAAAVDADLDADVASDFDRESSAEDAVWDTLGAGEPGADGPRSSGQG